jgi:secondary thiamine-phosphate synthase enzyme
MVKTETINVNSRGFCDVLDITREVSENTAKSGITNGIVTMFVPGATGAVTTIEYEGGLIRDFNDFWEKVLPRDFHYQHDKRWDDGNGFSHIRAALLGPSVTVPVVNGKLTLGT